MDGRQTPNLKTYVALAVGLTATSMIPIHTAMNAFRATHDWFHVMLVKSALFAIFLTIFVWGVVLKMYVNHRIRQAFLNPAEAIQNEQTKKTPYVTYAIVLGLFNIFYWCV